MTTLPDIADIHSGAVAEAQERQERAYEDQEKEVKQERAKKQQFSDKMMNELNNLWKVVFNENNLHVYLSPGEKAKKLNPNSAMILALASELHVPASLVRDFIKSFKFEIIETLDPTKDLIAAHRPALDMYKDTKAFKAMVALAQSENVRQVRKFTKTKEVARREPARGKKPRGGPPSSETSSPDVVPVGETAAAKQVWEEGGNLDSAKEAAEPLPD